MPNCLDNMPWRSLKGLGKYAADFLQLGDYRNVELKNGAQVQFRIIGFNHDKTSDGSLAPISWEMVDCLPNTYPWNRRDTNEGSWEATQIRRCVPLFSGYRNFFCIVSSNGAADISRADSSYGVAFGLCT